VTLILAVLVIAFTASGIMLRGRNQAGSFVLLGVGVAVACGMVFRVVFGSDDENPTLPRAALRLEQAAGNVLAGFIAKDFPEGGVVVVLRYPPVSIGDREPTQARFLALRNALGDRFSFIQMGPPNFDTSIPPPADFKLLEENADWLNAALDSARNNSAIAVVSVLTHIDIPASLPSQGARLYVFNSEPDLDEARMGAASRIGAIIRPTHRPPPEQPPSIREPDTVWFDIAYRALRK